MRGSTVIRLAIAIVVGVVWASSYAVSIVNHSYHPPAELNAIMLLVAGYFFASGIRRENERDENEIRHLIEEELRHEREAQQSARED